ncbi:transport protein particle component [Bimuria novae-zelandiae CBS 107.79]|uniref:Transport protein particle component n=1 Tax=Bimuria novae-zelandiae CBS 107.79 TaxID=1447943 RepID=A0A6A5V6I1_9PLEO|nr:transport protein particle component [Bimuria novae-zelandiae CBS 107.79]
MAAANIAPLVSEAIDGDPTATEVATSCLDFLLIELVPMAYRITADLAAKEQEYLNGPLPSNAKASQQKSEKKETDNDASSGGTATVVDEDEAREAVFHRLEALGYRVGLGVVERVSRTHPRPTSPLATIKFLCKDLWTLLFRKQIDNLKTNHRGIYVLTDNTFKPLTRMSFDTIKHTQATQSTAQTTITERANAAGDIWGDASAFGPDANSISRAQPFLYFPAGVVRGCLAGLGVEASVSAETSGLPGAVFQIRTVGAKA